MLSSGYKFTTFLRFHQIFGQKKCAWAYATTQAQSFYDVVYVISWLPYRSGS